MDWTTHEFKHVFNDKDNNNMQCVFFRFEFQNRNSIHIHLCWFGWKVVENGTWTCWVPLFQTMMNRTHFLPCLQKSDHADRAARNKPSDEKSYVDSNDNLVLKHTTKVNQFWLTLQDDITYNKRQIIFFIKLMMLQWVFRLIHAFFIRNLL